MKVFLFTVVVVSLLVTSAFSNETEREQCDTLSGDMWRVYSAPAITPEEREVQEQKELEDFLPKFELCKEGCENEDIKSCGHVATAFLKGPKLWREKQSNGDETGVALLYQYIYYQEIGCNLGDSFSCATAAYRGYDVNEVVLNHHYKEACANKDEDDGYQCERLGKAISQISKMAVHPTHPLELGIKACDLGDKMTCVFTVGQTDEYPGLAKGYEVEIQRLKDQGY